MANSNVIEFGAASNRKVQEANISSNSLRTLREIHGLNIIQAAAALDTTTHNIERWEATHSGPRTEVIEDAFLSYRVTNAAGDDTNHLFSVYPLRVARDMLGLSIHQMSERFGYSTSAWQKFESNQRLLDRKILLAIETVVRENFAAHCQR